MFLALIRLNVVTGPVELAGMLSPEMVQWLVWSAGLNPVAVMDFVGGVGAGMVCCGTQIFTGVMLAAVGTALYAAYRRT